ncbi:MAG: ATP-binding protein [Lachnospiraceae bacterium]
MAISNEQMNTILREYEVIRDKNHKLLASHKLEIQKVLPQYFDLHRAIVKLSMDFAMQASDETPDSLDTYHKSMQTLKHQKSALLEEHGYKSDYLEPIYNCPDCKDTGFCDTVKCHCLEKRINQHVYEQSNIDTYIQKHNFSTLSYDFYKGNDLQNFTKAVDASKHMIDEFETTNQNLLFFGDVGCGKSFLSGCIAKELIDSGYRVIYFSATTIFDIFYKNGLYNSLKDLYNYKLVIIDDLGSEMTSSFVTTALFSLLNERIQSGLSTIISTNLSINELGTRYSEKTASRIFHSFELCNLTGPDIRIIEKLHNRKRG